MSRTETKLLGMKASEPWYKYHFTAVETNNYVWLITILVVPITGFSAAIFTNYVQGIFTNYVQGKRADEVEAEITKSMDLMADRLETMTDEIEAFSTRRSEDRRGCGSEYV
jgi:hypothetical protein